MTVPCKSFVPFQHDVSVCDSCGHLGSVHSMPPVDDFHRAMWKVMVAFGGIHSFYAGEPYVDEFPTKELREHMARCAVDWRNTRPISMDRVACFVDSFSESSYAETLAGELSCKCGEYRRQEVILPGQTLGQLIWRAVHIDD